jgi:hypothetical protein
MMYSVCHNDQSLLCCYKALKMSFKVSFWSDYHCVITSVPLPVQLCGKSVVIHYNAFEFFVML